MKAKFNFGLLWHAEMSLTSMNQLKMIFVQNLPTTSKLTQKNSSNFANELTLNQKSS